MEGPQSVREAIACRPDAVRELFVTAEAAVRHADIVSATSAPVWECTDRALAVLSETQHPQGIAAVCTPIDVPLADALAPGARLVGVLSAIRDPGNAGTVIRCADAAGADAVVLAGEAVDVYNGKCIRASAGSLFHLPVVRGVAELDVLTAARAAGLQVFAATGSGSDDLDALADADTLAAPTAWVFGNEAWGLSDEVADAVDRQVRVPIHGRAESLNVATAAVVCLYASARAQRS